jgi:phenylacetate-coenzyme A ligase PaaK-like adenylate-forming protein
VDFGHVAMKHEERAWEVFPDLNILEADDAADPEEGDEPARPALVTTLYRRYLPLVRYRQGDLIAGVRRLPHGHVTHFDHLVGRVNDTIPLPGGSHLHSVALAHCIKDEPEVSNIQVVLTDAGVRILLACPGSLGDQAANRIRSRLAQLHPSLRGSELAVSSDVQTTRAGKRRWLIDQRSHRDD